MTDAIRDALVAARELAKLANELTGCRGDDEYVWGIEAKIDAALAALDAETEGWRTIDSAPKDGTRIELWHQNGDVLAGGYSIHGCWRDYQPGVWSWRSDAGTLIDAKYWRPVPSPPESRS